MLAARQQKALYEIGSVIEDPDNINDFINDFTVYIPYNYYNEQGKTVDDVYECRGLHIWTYMDYEYSLFQFPARVGNKLELKDALYRIWDIYVQDDVLVNLPRILTAFMSEYNPLENYNGVEKTDGFGSSRNHTGGKVKTKTDVSNSNTVEGETKHYETTYDNLSESQLRYKDTTKTPTVKTSGEADSNYTDYGTLHTTTKDDRETVDIDNNHLVNATDASNSQTVTRHGNLGVTTSQQMIEAEMNLRKFNIVKYIVDRFANLYLTLSRWFYASYIL